MAAAKAGKATETFTTTYMDGSETLNFGAFGAGGGGFGPRSTSVLSALPNDAVTNNDVPSMTSDTSGSGSSSSGASPRRLPSPRPPPAPRSSPTPAHAPLPMPMPLAPSNTLLGQPYLGNGNTLLGQPVNNVIGLDQLD